MDTKEWARLAPLALATMASQALLVVLGPIMVAVGADLGASVGAIGQARSVTAVVAIAVSASIANRVDTLGVSRLVAVGGAFAVAGCAAIASAPALAVFLLAHVLVGIAVACLLSAGFAGTAAFAASAVPGRSAGSRARTRSRGSSSRRSSAWLRPGARGGPPKRSPQSSRSRRLSPRAPPDSSSSAPAAAQLRTLVAHRSARRWLVAEVAAYGAWAALLTFVGAFFVERLRVGEGLVGWLLACGAASFFVTATRGAGLVASLPRRPLITAVSLLMGVLFVVELGASGSAAFGVAAFCTLGLAAGVRTPASSALGLMQLPDHPGAMMAARTAANQLGYLLGALVGGTVIAVAGYGAFGVVLAAVMSVSALLILRVDDPA